MRDEEGVVEVQEAVGGAEGGDCEGGEGVRAGGGGEVEECWCCCC